MGELLLDIRDPGRLGVTVPVGASACVIMQSFFSATNVYFRPTLKNPPKGNFLSKVLGKNTNTKDDEVRIAITGSRAMEKLKVLNGQLSDGLNRLAVVSESAGGPQAVVKNYALQRR